MLINGPRVNSDRHIDTVWLGEPGGSMLYGDTNHPFGHIEGQGYRKSARGTVLYVHDHVF
jgi:hypothetical protein